MVIGRSFVVVAAQAVAVGALIVALTQALEARQAAPLAPTPTLCRIVNLDDPKLADHEIDCAAADSTATAYIMVWVTATPCDRWSDENTTPIPTRGPRLMAPCAVVESNEFWTAHHATETAGIIDGSYYGLHVSNGAPNWTPTIYAYGTVPPEVLAGYPLTLTALPQETPHGWRLDGDRWVVDGGRP